MFRCETRSDTMVDWIEEEKGTINWTESEITEMTWKMIGDLTWKGLGEQTWANFFGKFSGPDFTEETKSTIPWTEESKE